MDAVFFADLLDFRGESGVVVVADSREEMVLDLEVKTKRNVESESGVLSEVHRMFNLTNGPTLEVLGLGSPFLYHARDM
jgi:hypothetical protein